MIHSNWYRGLSYQTLDTSIFSCIFAPGATSNGPDMEKVATVWYETLCTAIKNAAEKTLPSKVKKTMVERKFSLHTKKLFKLKRSLQRKANVSKADLQSIKARIYKLL